MVPFGTRKPTSPDVDGDAGTELAPADTSDVEHVGPVYDAEIVEETPGRQLVPAGVIKVLQPVIVVVRHDRTAKATKVLARNLV